MLVATGNRGKFAEICALFPGIAFDGWWTVDAPPLDEPGEDYLTNAAAKAREGSRASGRIVLGDDSGLEVDALGGAPGWRSARFSGAHGDDVANRARLRASMSRVEGAARRARFRCVLALADVTGPLGERVLVAYGTCTGRVTEHERGEGGFGYDPLLELEHTGRTMAEIDEATKNRVSHRGVAARAMAPMLAAYLRARAA